MPKWLVLSAVAAVIIIIVVMTVLNRRSLQQEPASNAVAEAAPAPAASAPVPQKVQAPAPAAQNAQGPVVLSAIEPAWIEVTDQGKTLFEGMLQPGQTFAVPATATAPLLKAGKPEALRVNVGSAVAPPVGPPGKVASKVSLKGADLMRGGAQPAAAQAPQAAAPAQ
jgi:hypothetical protein